LNHPFILESKEEKDERIFRVEKFEAWSHLGHMPNKDMK
jgi:hypothetical protein